MPDDAEAEQFYRRAGRALRRAARASEERVHAIDNLAAEINLANETIEQLLPQLPTRDEVDRHRRTAIIRVLVACVWLVIAAGFVSDEHVEHCSPGARTAGIAKELLAEPVPDLVKLRAAGRRPVPAWCDVVVPTHAHQPLARWPSTGNEVGAAGYLALAVGSALVVIRRRCP